MKVIRAFLMCFSMFCSIPCPIRFWDDGLRPLMTGVLPLVGLVIGALWALCARLCHVLDIPAFLAAAALTALPWVLSGYIHLDGFMDSCDAVLSRRDLEERRRILKDPLTGSFAVISLVILAIVCFGSFAGADLSRGLALLPVPAVTRGLSAAAVQYLKPMGHSQYARTSRPAYAVALPLVLAAVCFGLSFLLAQGAWICCLCAALGWCAACFRGYRQLEGMSGDISGYAITVGEACAVIAFSFI
ncbi:MAG: adenosylcobinamide-GDP ribazoletransferase [Candidatus Heteroscillospira sp.]|jgi:adenosylcobinamide-GDP ribazoletransferase